MANIKIILGDITAAKVDAIVNAAKPSLTGGRGVDGAIHKAAGPSLLEECLQLKLYDGIRCPVGGARITSAGFLESKWVIHTVGPIYKDSNKPQELLHSAYVNSIELAIRHKCKSVAFPAISCGKYGYPHEEAVEVAINSLKPYLNTGIEVYFYIVEEDLYRKYKSRLSIDETGT
ncbi:macro domain-containing protein [Moritella sp. 28]|uniref:macro domain-containing protein n=1 Tax=Moritella sp. 28 TaxID=2746232 RepID=UPI001BAA6544|nr:macro domain-containing protein [Moritella sp. 28]QUM85464.1 macro domain-containing protein [Moritella sp. 28]